MLCPGCLALAACPICFALYAGWEEPTPPAAAGDLSVPDDLEETVSAANSADDG